VRTGTAVRVRGLLRAIDTQATLWKPENSTCSFLELYNEETMDLLAVGDRQDQKLRIMEDRSGVVIQVCCETHLPHVPCRRLVINWNQTTIQQCTGESETITSIFSSTCAVIDTGHLHLTLRLGTQPCYL